MEPEDKYRHEFKYLCSGAQFQMLKVRYAGLLKPDPHAGPEGIYSIRSLYFDDYYDSCFRENEAGTDPREKFRIRIYNHDSSRISLELKRKVRGKTQKLSCPLTESVTRQIMEGEIPEAEKDAPALFWKLVLQMRTKLLRPKVIVEYERTPFVYACGNVRITFDEAIRSSDRFDLFLDERLPARLIMPAGQHVLEVKYDEYLPDAVYHLTGLENLRQMAYSKYYLCRSYSLSKKKEIT